MAIKPGDRVIGLSKLCACLCDWVLSKAITPGRSVNEPELDEMESVFAHRRGLSDFLVGQHYCCMKSGVV